MQAGTAARACQMKATGIEFYLAVWGFISPLSLSFQDSIGVWSWGRQSDWGRLSLSDTSWWTENWRRENKRSCLQIHFPSFHHSFSTDWQAYTHTHGRTHARTHASVHTHTRTKLHTQAKLNLTWAYYGRLWWSGVCRRCNNEAAISADVLQLNAQVH